MRNFNVQTLRKKPKIQLITCVPVLSESDITVLWCTFSNIDSLHMRAGSLYELIYRALSGYHLRSFNSPSSKVPITQPYSRSIAHPSSTVDVLYPQYHAELYHTENCSITTRWRSTPIIFARLIPIHPNERLSKSEM